MLLYGAELHSGTSASSIIILDAGFLHFLITFKGIVVGDPKYMMRYSVFLNGIMFIV